MSRIWCVFEAGWIEIGADRPADPTARSRGSETELRAL